MTARGYFRGYPIFWDEESKEWRFVDNNAIMRTEHDKRPCKKCGKVFQGSNPDPCLGNLPGVDNACCGHGIKEYAYIRFTNGVVVRNFDIEDIEKWGP
jgi:hypothetical protein